LYITIIERTMVQKLHIRDTSLIVNNISLMVLFFAVSLAAEIGDEVFVVSAKSRLYYKLR